MGGLLVHDLSTTLFLRRSVRIMALPLSEPSTSRCSWKRPCSPTPPAYTQALSLPSSSSSTTPANPSKESSSITSSTGIDPSKTTTNVNSSSTISDISTSPSAILSDTSTATPPTSGDLAAPSSPLQLLTSPVSLISPLSTSLVPTVSQSSSTQTSPVPRHLNVGAIAGGTVGGFVVLASFGLIVFLWLARRRRHRIAPSAAYRAAYGSTPPPIYPRVQSIPPGHHTFPSQASENFVVSSTRSTIFDGHRPSVAF